VIPCGKGTIVPGIASFELALQKFEGSLDSGRVFSLKFVPPQNLSTSRYLSKLSDPPPQGPQHWIFYQTKIFQHDGFNT
jgi:hypothetical protein